VSDEQLVLIERPADGVLVLTLNRPAVLNALNPELLAALRAGLAEARRGEDVGCAILTGAGRAFCAGADLRAVHAMTGDEFRRLTEAFRAVALDVRALGKPLIAAVNGHAVAGGFELACLCDFRLVARDAQLVTGDAHVNMSPTSGVSWLLPRIVGMGWAKYLALASPGVDGRQAVAIGLAQEALAADELMPRAIEVAATIAREPRLGIRFTRTALDVAAETGHETAIGFELELADRAFLHEDTKEAMAAFLEKRPARLSGG
jgi:enoyl-CoA hydratase/carnithine racemase